MSKLQREYGAVKCRVAMASAALRAIDEGIRMLKMQRKAAATLHEQRLAEHTQFILANDMKQLHVDDNA